MPTFRSSISDNYLQEFKTSASSEEVAALNICVPEDTFDVAEGLDLTSQHLIEFIISEIELDIIRLNFRSVGQGEAFNFLVRNVSVLAQNLLVISDLGGSK